MSLLDVMSLLEFSARMLWTKLIFFFFFVMADVSVLKKKNLERNCLAPLAEDVFKYSPMIHNYKGWAHGVHSVVVMLSLIKYFLHPRVLFYVNKTSEEDIDG